MYVYIGLIWYKNAISQEVCPEYNVGVFARKIVNFIFRSPKYKLQENFATKKKKLILDENATT